MTNVITGADALSRCSWVGNDPEYIQLLKQRAQGSERIQFRTPMPYDQLIARLNQYDVGIHVVPPTNFNNRWALPNKFFDYVQARLALIIGPSTEMRRVLEPRGFGAVADDFSVAALTRVLDSLTPDSVNGWKSRASAAARELSSEAQVEVWGAAVDALAKREET